MKLPNIITSLSDMRKNKRKKLASGGTRTRNPKIKSLML